jgi:hypothetical protein
MKHRLGFAVTLVSSFAVAAWAVAGPPLVCHPWVTAKAPPAPAPTWVDAGGKLLPTWQEAALRALDGETETLLRMDTVQRVLATENVDREGFVKALARRADEAQPLGERAAAARRFDAALAAETLKHYTGGEEGSARALAKAVRALDDDPAAWLALARAATPLMRTATSAEHARAFVKAYDLAHAMPESVAKERLLAVLAWDLEHLEAYLLDDEIKAASATPDAEARLAALRRHAAERD